MRHPGAPIGDDVTTTAAVSSGPSRSKKAARRAPPEYVDSEPMGEDDSDGMGDDYDDYDDDDDDVGQKRKAPAKRATGSSRSWLLPSCPLTDASEFFLIPSFEAEKVVAHAETSGAQSYYHLARIWRAQTTRYIGRAPAFIFMCRSRRSVSVI